jgi:hypothetical protein
MIQKGEREKKAPKSKKKKGVCVKVPLNLLWIFVPKRKGGAYK